jgi:N-acetylneuraminic acid mutarotase
MKHKQARLRGIDVSACAAFLLGSVSILLAAERHLPPLPIAVSSFGAAISDGYLYVYGGHAGQTHTYDKTNVLGTFHRLKLGEAQSWQELPAGPNAQGLNLVSHGGYIYRIGGMQPRNDPGEPADNYSLTSVARFDTKNGRWEELPPLPAGRSSYDVTVAGKWLVVVGGWQLRGRGQPPIWHDTSLLVDLEQPWKWQALPQPFRRRALAAVAVGQKVYALGGLSPDGPDLRVDILDLTTRQWQRGPDLPGKERAAFAPAACNLDGELILYTAEGILYRLSTTGDKWEQVAVAARKRLVPRLLPWHQRTVVLVGGAGGGQNHDSLEVIAIPPRQ